MPVWYVVTPTFEEVEPVLDDGSGPTYSVRDVIEIEAGTARDAVALGVIAMLRSRYPQPKYIWVHDQRADGRSPFAGVRAIKKERITHEPD